MDAETIEKNWKTYTSLLERLSDENIDRLISDLGERIVNCPSSLKSEYNGCYPGGLIEMGLRITSVMRKLNDSLEQKLPVASIVKVGLLHDLGKIGGLDVPHFVEQDSDWHRQKLGQLYKYNEDLEKMTYPHRTLWLLQHYGVSLTRDEWETISTSGGYHLEENRFYVGTKNALGRLLCAAKLLSI